MHIPFFGHCETSHVHRSVTKFTYFFLGSEGKLISRLSESHTALQTLTAAWLRLRIKYFNYTMAKILMLLKWWVTTSDKCVWHIFYGGIIWSLCFLKSTKCLKRNMHPHKKKTKKKHSCRKWTSRFIGGCSGSVTHLQSTNDIKPVYANSPRANLHSFAMKISNDKQKIK